MLLSKKQIHDIAGDLDMGMRCFYHKKTYKIHTILDFDKFPDGDEELWEEDINYIDENFMDMIEFKAMTSRDSFEVMEDFVESIDDKNLQKRLINALSRRKPFQNFKIIIENNWDYRKQWFDFKNQRNFEWVENQVKNLNLNHKN